MYDKLFAELMVIALGTMAGTGAGLIIGWAAGKQKNEWSAMSRNEKLVTIALIIVFTLAFTAVLAWYSLVIYQD
jgi:hypothetical protein